LLWAQAPAPAPAAAGAIGVTEAADGKGYKYLVPVASLWGDGKAAIRQREAYANVRKILNGEQPLAADNRSYFENYYNLYQFPFMTLTTDKELKTLPEERQRFIRDHLELSGRQAEVHGLLISLTLDTMTRILRDEKFHPAVRYNAMMIISSLNDQEPVRVGGTPTLPIPMVRALPIILEEFKRPQNSDAIKVAALLGLSRHLEWENEKTQAFPPMPAQLRKDVIAELIAFAADWEAPEGRSPEGHLWLRRRTIEALGFAAAKKPDAEIADALDALLKDETEPLSLRCAVAAAIGRISYQAPAKVDSQAMAKELGYLALVACETELNRATTMKKDEEDHALRLQGQIPDPTSGTPVPMSVRGTPGGGGLSGEGRMTMPGPGGGGMMPGPGGVRGGTGTADSGGYGVGYDPSLEDPKAYRFDLVRRRIRQELYCVQLGLLGGEDHPPPKSKGGAPTPPTPPAGGAAGAGGAGGGTTSGGPAAPKAEPRGIFVATPAAEKQFVDDVYLRVRSLIEVVETKAVDLSNLEKELRKEMKNLETTIGRKVPPPVTVAAATATDDVGGAGGAGATKGGKPGTSKAGVKGTKPGKTAPVMPGKGPKTAPMGKAAAGAS
jgi:hypothetical protein